MALLQDPLNLIISGVGGQGNVVISRLLGRAAVKRGYFVTVGETFGAAQRGGAVMSHIRISQKSSCGPLIPRGKAHIILSLELMEAIRALKDYGNPEVVTISNSYSLPPIDVIMGQFEYPGHQEIRKTIHELSQLAWFVDATRLSIDLGAPVLANIVMVGALVSHTEFPLNAGDIKDVIKDSFPPDKVELNLKAVSILRRKRN